jgi:hypothetical protein
MTKIERIEANLKNMQNELNTLMESQKSNPAPTTPPRAECDDEDTATLDAGQAPYQIAATQKHPIPLSYWVSQHRSDPAFKVSWSIFHLTKHFTTKYDISRDSFHN